MPYIEGTTGLSPLIKWAGGKEKELKIIVDNVPNEFNNYYEPFVGGGSVFMAMDANHHYINDLSHELISLYKNIADKKEDFYKYSTTIDEVWINIGFFIDKNMPQLLDLYRNYKRDDITEIQLKCEIDCFCESNKVEILHLVNSSAFKNDSIVDELKKSVFHKMLRMKSLERKKIDLPESDLKDNIETAVRSALYFYFRNMYNDNDLQKNEPLYNALFLFIRNFAFSGMFRYNDDGDFNVPYGGIAYNRKTLSKKLDYYRSEQVMEHFNKTTIENLDFEVFMRKYEPSENDFVFLDPPYDSEFSTYAKNAFGRDEQKRLANYLINDCKGKWMMIIKHTDFIKSLYDNHLNINILAFDKKYQVSFKNRNDRNVEHLIIKNY